MASRLPRLQAAVSHANEQTGVFLSLTFTVQSLRLVEEASSGPEVAFVVQITLMYARRLRKELRLTFRC